MKKLIVGMIFSLFITVNTHADGIPDGGQVKGMVFDQNSKLPIEYATIAFFNAIDSTLVTGTITDLNGNFNATKIAEGNYYIKVNFLGYEESHYSNLVIDNSKRRLDIGTIFLETSSQFLEEVVITNDRNPVEFHIDKKVVHVGEQMTSASLSAVEVLENVPSIRVDVEGNVSLRGSTGFTVLIDGKPTVLDPSDVLRQTPASTIQNIEIITNPSSRYQPDGTGGIINIISKKNRVMGLQGLFNLKTNTFGEYGGDFLLNYRKGKTNFYFGGDYRQSPYPGETSSERLTTLGDTTTIIEAAGDTERLRGGGGLRMGLDWDISPRNSFSIGIRAGEYRGLNNSRLDYLTYRDPFDFQTREISLNESGRGALYYNLTGSFQHKFEQKDHELMLQFNHRIHKGDEFSENYLQDENGLVNQGTRTTEKGPSNRLEIKLDYTKPLSDKHGLEAGFQIRSGRSGDATELYVFDLNEQDFIHQADKSNYTDYIRNIYALYGIFKGTSGKLGYQAGLRGEYTSRDIIAEESIEDYTLERYDFFPTLHLSYQLPKEKQLMASYSRRIDRPRGYSLEPFITWTDMYNVRRGNPELKPEYIDAMELGFIHSSEKSQLSLEAYYRIKHNKVERTREVYEEGILLQTFTNVGTDYSLGLEALYNISLFQWWELNLMGDLYNYRIDSEINGSSSYHSFNWGTRVNNTFSIAKRIRVQFDGNYNSATVTTQGEDKGYYSFNAAVRSDFLDKSLSLVLQVRDVFSTMERVSVTRDLDFYNYYSRSTRAPIISLTASYRLNNYKQSKRGNRSNDGGGEEF
jgi:Outer membrane protein beta-barrel family/CarboxypepD_reg-like domain/TonB-dependent Receptor Plug Domain